MSNNFQIDYSKNIINKNKEDIIKLEDFFQIKVIEPRNIYHYLINNQIHQIIINKIMPEIKNKNINFFIIPLPYSELNIWWTDYPESYLDYFYDSEYKESQYLYMTVKLNKDLTLKTDEEITINHNLEYNKRQGIYNLFKKELPYNFTWNGTVSSNIIINYQSNTTPAPDLIIAESNIYPCCEIFIEAEVDNLIDNNYRINSFDDNPFEKSDFIILWEEILSSSEVIDYGFKYANNTYLIDFVLESIHNKEILKKLKEIKNIFFEKFSLKIVDITGIVNFTEDEDIDIHNLKV